MSAVDPWIDTYHDWHTIAGYHGKCPDCDKPIRPGQKIIALAALERVWTHEDCTEYAEDDEIKARDLKPPKDQPLCTRCHMYHRGECL